MTSSIYIGRGSINLGAFSEEEVRDGLRSGRFFQTDLGWREGMENWKPLSQFAEFSAAPGEAAPPLPGTTLVSQSVAQAKSGNDAVAPGNLPWDERAQLGIVHAFVGTLKLVLVDPTNAFARMRREGSLGSPLLYGVIGACFGAVFATMYQILLMSQNGGVRHEGYAGRFAMSMGGSIVVLIFSPVIAAVGFFISAAISHLCLLLVGGANESFETTLRVICFAVGSTSVLQIVPGCGGLIAAVWNIVALIIGFSQAHRISTGRAVAAVFLPLIVCCGGGLLAVLTFFTVHHHAM